MVVTKYDMAAPLSIAFLSDVHNNRFDRIIEETRKLAPDIIAVTGDVINGHETNENEPIVKTQENVLPFLKACAETAPTFFSFGNHEWMLTNEDEELIKETGVSILDNSFVRYNGILIGGLTSAMKTEYRKLGIVDRYPEKGELEELFKNRSQFKPDVSWLERFEQHSGFKLLLSHHPEYYNEFLRGRNIDLVLSGHCHGGQIRLFGRGLFAPGQGVLPKLTKGVHDKMIISTGLSNTAGVIPRLFNPTEIVFISNNKTDKKSAHP